MPFRKKGKYGAQKCSLDGYSFASKLEASVYQILKFRMLAGEFEKIQVQDHVYLSAAEIPYIADFKCILADGSYFYCEAKGFEAPVWPIKKRLYKAYGLVPLEIWKGTYQKPFLFETIIPASKKTHSEDE